MSLIRRVPFLSLIALLLVSVAAQADSERVKVSEGSDARAIEIAQATVDAMGGWSALDSTRFVSWKFFGVATALLGP